MPRGRIINKTYTKEDSIMNSKSDAYHQFDRKVTIDNHLHCDNKQQPVFNAESNPLPDGDSILTISQRYAMYSTPPAGRPFYS
jgi:hypothetical protein